MNEAVKPFVSLFIVISFLFTIVFIKMENRRLGYSLLKLYQKEKKSRESERNALVRLSKLSNPERVKRLATRLYEYDAPKKGQVIRIAASGSAVIQ